ncbi:MAG: hypothetical protein KF865_11780 [Bdellovibrionaceae bacterium]|nr:hypothetical protein [Pseudobdellovibrionaceae bacterium]
MSDELRIVLVGAAKAAHDKMLSEVRADEKVTINSSKLINWIVQDYFDSFFAKRKNRICRAHLNSRKYMMAVMKGDDPQAIRKALQELARNLALEKKTNDDSSEENAGSA